ncbi:hypothetical protein BKA58DRAFT_387544 [Alternaria rosae]|uniref:uncharacterized protein n=1 Tax=Alternaria rosae TaxID=1187941 RepID=UPI001E8D6D36|nr:uncharacterized protein BKA58DRAFT_387544 [Alternaria rosae]KAH6868761.1 hypothetical protein BKA58DRAFT_387544 [Alternaria rosae]
MSGQPQVPSISTSVGNRAFTDSLRTRTSSAYSPALSNPMSSRAGKRPLEPQARGESPPDKRSRPPDKRSALQDRPRQNVRVLSPSNFSSGASTPTHHAPPMPSMLPTPDPGVLQQQDVTSATTSNTPFTMKSLRKLKERKRAIAQQTTITVSTSVDVKLNTQALDIANLKKERDDIKKELLEINKAREEEHDGIVRRLVQVEALSTRVDSFTNKTETLNIVKAVARPLAARLEALERSAADLPNLQQELQDLNDEIKDVNSRLSERITSHQDLILKFQAFKETVEKQTFSDQLKTLSDKITEIEGNVGRTYAKASRLQKKFEDLEDAFTLTGVEKLRETVDKLKDRLDKYRNEAGEDREEAAAMHKKLKDTQEDLSTLQKDFDDLSDDINTYIGPIKNDHKKTNLALSQRVANLQSNVTQAELGRLPTRLSELENNARLTEKLPGRVDELENAAWGPHFKKVGIIVAPSSPAAITPPVTNADTDVSLLKKSLQELRKVVEGTSGLTNQAQTIFERLNNMEATLANARPLDSMEQSVETMDTTMDKTSVKTLEKAAEPKVKALMTTERKVVVSIVEEVETRLTGEIQALRTLTETRMEEIQAFRIRSREPGFAASSADARTAPSEVGDLNGITQDIETLFTELDSANATISAVQEVAPTLFNEQFDPLKRKVEEQLSTVTATLEKHACDLSDLAQQVSKSPSQQNGFGQAQQSQLNTISTEVASLKTGLATLRLSLSTKADSESVNKELETFNFAMRNMESRYENISTDTLYQGMVRWFTQMYPGLPQLQDEIHQLHSWIEGRANLLDRLNQDATQLHGLVNIAPHLHEIANISPQLKQVVTDAAQLQSAIQAHGKMSTALTKIDQASSDASLAISKAEAAMRASGKADQASSDAKTASDKVDQTEQRLSEQLKTLENIKGSVSGLQTSLRNLNSATSPFVKAEALGALQVTVKALQTQIGQEKQERLTSTEKLCTTIDADHGTRVDEETKIRKSIQDLEQTIDVDKATFAKAEVLTALQGTLRALQSEVSNTQAENSAAVEGLRSAFDSDCSKRDTVKGNIQKPIKELAQTPAKAPNSDNVPFENFKRVMVDKFASEKKARTDFEENLKSSLGIVEGKITALRQDTVRTSNEVKRVSSDHETTKQGIYDQLADINTAAAELREVYDKMVRTYIEPNSEFFGLIGTAFVVLSQVQQVVESLNQNLPVAPLKLEWDYYLPTHGQPETNGAPSKPKGKGKSKQ